MSSTDKNTGRLDNVDYTLLIQQAREQRARYLASLFSKGLSMVKQHILKQQPSTSSKTSRRKLRATKHRL